MALSSPRQCPRMHWSAVLLALLLAPALLHSASSEASSEGSIQQGAASLMESNAAGTRHLLQYQGFVLNETPRERMERLKREMLTSQQSAAAAASSAATSSSATSSAAAQSSSEEEGEEERSRAILHKMYKKADESTARGGSSAEDGEFQVETPEEELTGTGASATDSATATDSDSATDSDTASSSSGDAAQGAATGAVGAGGTGYLARGSSAEGAGVTGGAGGSEGGAEPAAAAAVVGRELTGCTLKMYGGRPAKNGKEHYGGWTMCSEGLRKGAVVYSFGIGSDVSFDYACLRRGAKVYGFDPTKTPEYVRQTFLKQFGINEFPRRFKYYQIGFGATDETVPFFKPTYKGVGSMTAVPLSQLSDYKDVGFYAKVQSLMTCRRQLRHKWVDILKVDAEGVELEACESRLFLRALGQVTQVLFEFHDRMVSGGKRKKLRCIRRLQSLGFTVVHQTVRSREVTFARLAQFSGAQGEASEKTATA